MEIITLIGGRDKWLTELIGIIGVPNVNPGDPGPFWLTIILPTEHTITGVKYEGNDKPDFKAEDLVVQGSRLGDLRRLVIAMIDKNKSFTMGFGASEQQFFIQWSIKANTAT